VIIQETYGDWLTITKELSLNAKKRHLPRIKLNRLTFVTLFPKKRDSYQRKTEPAKIHEDVSLKHCNKLF
jgi:hypothetical protein